MRSYKKDEFYGPKEGQSIENRREAIGRQGCEDFVKERKKEHLVRKDARTLSQRGFSQAADLSSRYR